MWRISESVSFDRRARMWVWRGDRLIGAVNIGALRAYVFPLYTPLGRLVIQESPVDHPHHQGLFVGADVNGHDMWNAGSFGNPSHRQAPVEALCTKEAHADGARFQLVLDWSTESGVPVMREERTLSFSQSGYGNVVDERCRFVAAYGDIHLARTKEAGLAMRVPPEWETPNGGVMLDAAGHVGESQIWYTVSDWIDVSGEGPRGVLAGITLMKHHDSPPAPWMSRDYGLHNYDPWHHQEISLPKGEVFQVGVRFVAHDGRATEEEIAEWYRDAP